VSMRLAVMDTRGSVGVHGQDGSLQPLTSRM
jgi:hypothetical protein